MNLFYVAQNWGILDWTFLLLMIGFFVLWVSGTKGLNDVEERWFKIEQFDQYYALPGGFLLLQLRNVAVFLILFIIFKIV